MHLALLFDDYEAISTYFRGWPLSEIRNMTKRERKYWVKIVRRRLKIEDTPAGV